MATPRRGESNTSIDRDIQALLFLDIRGYSALNEHELGRFFEQILPELARITKKSGSNYSNTWGDAIVCASKQPSRLCHTALEFRDFFARQDWSALQIRPLIARIALHAGPMYTGFDPFTGKRGMIGTQVNLAARIEPITPAGQVWATDAFVHMLYLESHDSINCDDLGERQLAKAWGAKRLFRIRRSTEPAELSDLFGQPLTVPAHKGRQETWQKIRSLLRRPTQPEEYRDALREIFTVVGDTIHSVTPVVRLWGNRGGLAGKDREVFEQIGQDIGRCCVEKEMAVSGSMLHPNTLEYWVLMGARDMVSRHPHPFQVYLHFNGSESPYTPGEGEQLFKALPSVFHTVEVKYPQHDSYYQNAINEEISYEKSPAHDVRLGSLFQCDAVILLGGSHSARHLSQLVAFVGKQQMRAAKPILYIPIPWVGGTARKAYESFNGIIEELDFSSLL